MFQCYVDSLYYLDNNLPSLLDKSKESYNEIWQSIRHEFVLLNQFENRNILRKITEEEKDTPADVNYRQTLNSEILEFNWDDMTKQG